MYLVTAKEMQLMDGRTIESIGVPGRVLMENAARGATRVFLQRFPEAPNRRVGVLAGRGNNGGDGFVMARYLFQEGADVTVFLLSEKGRAGGDAGENLKLLDALGVPVWEMPDKAAIEGAETFIRAQDLWVDAIFGTGLNAEVRGHYRTAIERLNEAGRPIFSVDIPSGLHADTGQPCGVCVRASATATFAFPKVGHRVPPGPELTGDLFVVDIGIPPAVADGVAPRQHLITPATLRPLLRSRPPDAHKGTTGHLLVVAGSPGKTGAAAMAAAAALRAGAGLATLGIPQGINTAMEVQTPETMTHPLPEIDGGVLGESAFPPLRSLLDGKTCLAIGPGLGTAEDTVRLVLRLLEASPVPAVVDADGLNCLAVHPRILKNLKTPPILTPHPGEMARLTGSTPAEVQSDRIGHARQFAETYQVHLVLKGAGTIVAHPDGTVHVNPTGNPGMASGGMGDVLTGIIAGLVTQGYDPGVAARLGVYLHGAAADELARSVGPAGYLATEVMAALPKAAAALSRPPRPEPFGFERPVPGGRSFP